jgi:tripartite ATP-independent transporter DctM subunit
MLASDPLVTSAIAQGITAKPMALSITDLFLAGILPGFLLLATLITVGLIISISKKYPKGDPVVKREIPMTVFHGLLSLTPALIILGSIIFGWATATEAGAIAVIYSFFLATTVYRELTLKGMWPVLVRTFRTVLMVFFLIGASASFGYVMSELRLPELITKWVLSISNSPIVILLLINILLLILGGPMDMAPMILILTPILLPVCMGLDMNSSLPGVQGMHPIQFGLILIFNAGMGLLTPPVGTVLFVGCAIGKVSVNAGTKAMMPFFIAMIVALLLITYVPSISMWLPVEFPKWFPSTAIH